jgi:hypothetical protein
LGVDRSTEKKNSRPATAMVFVHEEVVMNRFKAALVLVSLLFVSFTSGTSWADRGDGRSQGARSHDGRSYGGDSHDGRSHGGHSSHGHSDIDIGVVIGAPVVRPWYYYPRPYYPYYYPRPYYYPSPPYYYPPPPYYYYPPVVTVPSSPPVYIEKGGEEAGAPQESNYWHYCDNPRGYYPEVKECPGGWQRVSPRPPSPPPPPPSAQ